MEDIKDRVSAIEDVDIGKQQGMSDTHEARGTVKLLDKGVTILIPTPSPDPKGELRCSINGHVSCTQTFQTH